MLAGKIGERNLYNYEALQAAAEYIARSFQEMGYGVQERTFSVQGRTVKNLEAELPGTGQSGEIVLIGAHYDTVLGSPGANDNASGVAALLVLARMARQRPTARTRRFVAFVNEEPPFFLTSLMGSRIYAREAARRGDRITAMLSLETIGCFSDAPRSQSYPFPLSLFYPGTGNFIGFVGNLASRPLARRIMSVFRENSRFPSEGVAAPAIIPGIGWSDHWSFWKEGYQAVMITDTALFRYPQYHTEFDEPSRVDCARVARLISGLAFVLDDLAGP
jgi:Zn-dependent M28 family amino/carboxypeptidase